MEFMEIINIIGTISGAIAVVLFVMFRKSLQKYVDEKAKNLATIEDTQKITDEVEKVKSDYQQKSHAWKQLFEKEYIILKDVWDSAWELQAHARSLRPSLDDLPQDPEERKEVFIERHSRYVEAVKSFKDNVIKNRPFIPTHVYDACMTLRIVVIELEVGFEMSFNDGSNPDWEAIRNCGKELDVHIENLNTSIREHIYGKLK